MSSLSDWLPIVLNMGEISRAPILVGKMSSSKLG